MKIVYFDRTGGACDYYRAILPMSALRKYGKHEITEITRADVNRMFEKGDYSKLTKVENADVILMPRLAEIDYFYRIKEANPKAKIVLEYDDNIFDISPLSPHYQDHGTEEVVMELQTGEKINVWTDGVNIDLKKNKKLMEDLKKALREADMVTTTTDILAQHFRKLNGHVKSLPNCLDLSLWRKLPLKPHRGIRLGWFGGSSHYEDWCVISDALKIIMKMKEELTLVIMGVQFKGTLKDIPNDKIEFHPWVLTPAYPYKAAILDLDIGLIPLRDTQFNRCKSSIKWVEMSALEVPSVCSHISPYKENATEDNGVWIEENDITSWVNGIEYLINKKSERSKIGLAARQTVVDDYDIAKNWQMWEKAYMGVLNGVSNSTDSK